jgi:RNA polymerase sigma factor (TIGR02999 family)
MTEVTRLLEAMDKGDRHAAARLLTEVYEELRKLAAARMAREEPGQTLQPTALVHEAWLRVSGEGRRPFASRAEFFAAAAESMRRILVDKARRRRAARHGGGMKRVDISDIDIAAPGSDDELLAIHGVLDQFAALDPPKAELVKLRYFAGLKIAEAAATLGISEATAKRWWTYARAWLFDALSKSDERQNDGDSGQAA